MTLRESYIVSDLRRTEELNDPNLEELIIKVITGEICSWEQMMLMKIMMNVSEKITDESIFGFFLKHLRYKSFYDLINKALGKESSGGCDVFLKNNNFIDFIIQSNNVTIIKENASVNTNFHLFDFGSETISMIDILKWVDVRNPSILLTYFLKSIKDIQTEIYFNMKYEKLLNFVLMRTEKRATKNETFKKILPKLKKVQEDLRRKCMYTF